MGRHENNSRGQQEAAERLESLPQQRLLDAPMPVMDDILDRTRLLNGLKIIAEKSIFQTFVFVAR